MSKRHAPAEPNEEEPFRSIEQNRAKPSDKPSETRTKRTAHKRVFVHKRVRAVDVVM